MPEPPNPHMRRERLAIHAHRHSTSRNTACLNSSRFCLVEHVRHSMLKRLLALLMHALLRWHGIPTLLLCSEILLILQCLLMIGGHVWLWDGVIRHAGLRHCLWNRWSGLVRLFWRLDLGVGIDAVRVGWLGCVQACLSMRQ